MDGVFNPNPGAVNAPAGPDLMQQMIAAKRQRAIAEALRAQADRAQVPQGQMVSGHYVAPSIFQHLNSLFQQYQAGRAGSAATRAEEAGATAAAGASRDWESSLPQAIAAQVGQDPPQDIGGNMIQGPQYEKSPAQPVTTPQILKAALSGMRIPGNEKAAETYLRTALADQTREDNQQFKRDEGAAQRIAMLEAKRDQLRQQAEIAAQKSADTRYQADLQAEWRRQHDALLAQIAKGNQEIARIRAENAGGPKPSKPLPAAQSKAWIENNTSMGKVQKVMGMLVGPDGKPTPLAKSSMGAQYMLPFSEEIGQRTDPNGVKLRAAIADIGSLKIHDRSGAAVSAKEWPRLKPFVPSASDTPEAAADKLQNFMREYATIQQEIEDYADDMGYIKPGKAAAARTDFTTGGTTGNQLPPGVTVTPRKK